MVKRQPNALPIVFRGTAPEDRAGKVRLFFKFNIMKTKNWRPPICAAAT
jgi:hypothetical protein